MKKSAALLLVIISFIAGTIFHRQFDFSTFSRHKSSAEHQEKIEKQPLYWVAPMDSNYRRDKPGKSPMGMDLIPVYDEPKMESKGIKVPPHIVQSLGIKSVTVQKKHFSHPVQTIGYVEPDESRITHIHTYTEGWIKKLSANVSGAHVEKGELLFELYSLPLINAQHEYILSTKSKDLNLSIGSDNKLKALGMTQDQIEHLKRTHQVMELVKFIAPQSGIVTDLHVREGMYVTPGKSVLTIENLSKVWVIAQIFEKQMPWVKIGDKATIALPEQPSQAWQGEVEYLYPMLDAKTRTQRVRLIFDNSKAILKPNMQLDVAIQTQTKDNVLVIPRSAVIYLATGPQVIVEADNGNFTNQKIKLGWENGDEIEVIEGLKEGSKVVVQGQFLLDSEVNMKAGLERIDSMPQKTMKKQSKTMDHHHSHHQHHAL